MDGVLAFLGDQFGFAARAPAIAFQSSIYMADMDVLAIAQTKRKLYICHLSRFLRCCFILKLEPQHTTGTPVYGAESADIEPSAHLFDPLLHRFLVAKRERLGVRERMVLEVLGARPVAVSPVLADTITGRVVGVLDGDTVDVLDADHSKHRIRLAGIDAPEKRQPFGARAKQQLSDLVYDQQVQVEWRKLDRYGRVIGKIEFKSADVNLEMIRRGLAWWYRQYAREQSPEDRSIYAEAEEGARKKRQGLWSDLEPVPPWEFRRDKRGN